VTWIPCNRCHQAPCGCTVPGVNTGGGLNSVWTGMTKPAFFPVLSDSDVDRIARRLAQIIREEKP